MLTKITVRTNCNSKQSYVLITRQNAMQHATRERASKTFPALTNMYGVDLLLCIDKLSGAYDRAAFPVAILRSGKSISYLRSGYYTWYCYIIGKIYVIQYTPFKMNKLSAIVLSDRQIGLRNFGSDHNCRYSTKIYGSTKKVLLVLYMCYAAMLHHTSRIKPIWRHPPRSGIPVYRYDVSEICIPSHAESYSSTRILEIYLIYTRYSSRY